MTGGEEHRESWAVRMSLHCTDPERLRAWCAALAGEDLAERRSELFWQYAKGRLAPEAAAEVSAHVESCPDCRQALDSERLLIARGTTIVSRCPSSKEMLEYLERGAGLSPWRRLEIKMHLGRCELCREEASWAAKHVALSPAEAAEEPKPSVWAWLNWKWIAAPVAAALVLAAVLLYPTQFGSRRYAHLARIPDIPYEMMVAEFASAHPAEAPRFQAAAEHIRLGDYDQGEEILRELEARYADNPGIAFFRGYIAVRKGRWREATLLCAKAEPSDLDGFRCWYLANVALKAGDLALARREIRHAQGHTPYQEAARRLEQKID
jgi:hypothetical protein